MGPLFTICRLAVRGCWAQQYQFWIRVGKVQNPFGNASSFGTVLARFRHGSVTKRKGIGPTRFVVHNPDSATSGLFTFRATPWFEVDGIFEVLFFGGLLFWLHFHCSPVVDLLLNQGRFDFELKGREV